MLKFIDEYFSKDSVLFDFSFFLKLVNFSQSLGDVKKNIVVILSGGYDFIESLKNKVFNVVSKVLQINSQLFIFIKLKCYSVEIVVDRIIKKVVNDSFFFQKLQIYFKDQKWKSL